MCGYFDWAGRKKYLRGAVKNLPASKTLERNQERYFQVSKVQCVNTEIFFEGEMK